MAPQVIKTLICDVDVCIMHITIIIIIITNTSASENDDIEKLKNFKSLHAIHSRFPRAMTRNQPATIFFIVSLPRNINHTLPTPLGRVNATNMFTAHLVPAIVNFFRTQTHSNPVSDQRFDRPAAVKQLCCVHTKAEA